ncbi:MAG TPA: prepilin-type N-terminal cleavage/methylation domain-containing protein [Acidimicrobiales bacterium]|nr:prepilin-type N-terminal cleavage/methylation domain-containing protein [Acidimicrobiales bacterium]
MRLPSRRDEGGFTLAELLIVVVIIGIIAGPLIDAFIQGLDTTGRASTSLGSSHDAQLTDYYLERDAVGSSASTSPPAGWLCAAAGGVSVPTAATGVVEFSWNQAPHYSSTMSSGQLLFAPGSSYEADYLYQGSHLTRYYCTVSGSPAVGSAPQVTEVASGLSLTTAPSATIADCGSAPTTTPTSTPASPGGKSPSICTTVQLTDPNGTVYSAVLYQRTSS